MSSSTGYYEPGEFTPLTFHEARCMNRIAFFIIAIVTAVFVLATFGGMFLFKHISGTHIFLNVCLILLLGSHLCLAFWYRSGELEPRFRTMLFFNTGVIILLCICANLIMSGK